MLLASHVKIRKNRAPLMNIPLPIQLATSLNVPDTPVPVNYETQVICNTQDQPQVRQNLQDVSDVKQISE